jgi:membrane protein YqaA with SNARE-associated domain
MKNRLKRLHARCMQWVNTKWGVWVLFICSFADASFLPMPTPLIFLALAMLNTSRAYKYAIYGILGTLTGAFAGYTIGHYAWIKTDGEFSGFALFLFDNLPGFSIAVYDKIRILYEKWDFWILFVAASLPLPYKIFSISSGVFDINILLFCIATLVSQSIKFLLLALLTIKLGAEARKLLEYNWKPVLIITMACLAIVIIVIKVF